MTIAPAFGSEDTAIPIEIAATSSDTSETLSITISGVPAGAVLSGGADQGGGTWILTPDQLAGLAVTPPADFDGGFTLTVTAISTDGTAAPASTTQTVQVSVAPVSDALILHVADAAGTEDTAVPLDIGAAITDPSEVLAVTISGMPAGATLSAGTHNSDGTWTLTPAQLADSRSRRRAIPTRTLR